MARKKRTSTALEVAQRRLAGLKSIDTEFDLGSDMKRSDFEARINGLVTRLNLYNQHSAELDQEQNDLDAEEALVNDWSKRWLAATGAKFGTDSNEYEAVGGTRTSERKKPKRGGLQTGGFTSPSPGDLPTGGVSSPAPTGTTSPGDLPTSGFAEQISDARCLPY